MTKKDAEHNFTIGTDPEFFMVEEETGKMKSSIPFVNGTKENPEIMECGAGFHKDNVAVEFSSVPTDREETLVSGIREAFTNIIKRLPEGHSIATVPSASFDEDQLEDEGAFEFGCDEDYDAWRICPNEVPFCEDVTFRSCGGHIHLGYVNGSKYVFLLNQEGKIETVRAMDAVVGVSSVVLDDSEASVKRRLLYGKAGCHRPTDYGVEYRVLSNFWLKSPKLVMLMYRMSGDVLNLIESSAHKTLIENIGSDNIIEVINNGKIEEAKRIMDEHVRHALSDETSEMLDTCLEECKNYELAKEWSV